MYTNATRDPPLMPWIHKIHNQTFNNHICDKARIVACFNLNLLIVLWNLIFIISHLLSIYQLLDKQSLIFQLAFPIVRCGCCCCLPLPFPMLILIPFGSILLTNSNDFNPSISTAIDSMHHSHHISLNFLLQQTF